MGSTNKKPIFGTAAENVKEMLNTCGYCMFQYQIYISFSPFVRNYGLISSTMCVTAMNGHAENLHEPIEFSGEGREWLNSKSPAASALRRDVIFDGRWLNSLSYYVRNRHTRGDWR